ncbi:MAG: MarR family transcriptional regulator [Bacilli bacterium]|nr:MarR family transcriptional regulator [Bacilli bacterium]
MEESIIDESKNLHRNLRFLQKEVFNKFVEYATANLPPDLSAVEHRLMMYVGDHEGCLSVDIAAAMYLKKSTISGMVNSLVEKGFISLRKSGEDKRKLPIHLTEKGNEAYEVAKRKFEVFDKQLESGLSEEDIKTLYRICRVIERNVKEVRDGD